MTKKKQRRKKELTPVDDVRRIRERFCREAGSIEELIRRANEHGKLIAKKYGLKTVYPPPLPK